MNDRLVTRIHESRRMLGNPYAHLNDRGEFDAVSLNTGDSVREGLGALQNPYAFAPGNIGEFELADKPTIVERIVDPSVVLGRKRSSARLSRPELESIARRFQIELWKRRAQVFRGRESVSPIEILDPQVALASIGFETEFAGSLGQYDNNGEAFEVAGIIDRPAGKVQVSSRFSPAIQNFTLAHELGHAVIHDELEIHRDRAVDGTREGSARDTVELEADVFAAYFLMPGRLVRTEFELRFLTQRFVLNELTAFALNVGNLDVFRTRCRTLRDLTRYLADATQFNGNHFDSMARRFRVSIEAMAIRLEELRIVGLSDSV